jgi:hypothetical protein
VTTAISIINDAYGRCNRLSPGETLGPDEAAFAFARLNILIDELGAEQEFLFRDVLTSVVQTGNITLGTGSWAAVASGAEIISATADNLPLAPITMQQYNELYAPTQTGIPNVWAQDGLSTVFLYPVPTGQTIKLQTRVGVSAFADQTTDYTMPPGYKSALGAMLAVKLAPTVLGQVPAELIRAEMRAMNSIKKYDPAVIDVYSYGQPQTVRQSILFGG